MGSRVDKKPGNLVMPPWALPPPSLVVLPPDRGLLLLPRTPRLALFLPQRRQLGLGLGVAQLRGWGRGGVLVGVATRSKGLPQAPLLGREPRIEAASRPDRSRCLQAARMHAPGEVGRQQAPVARRHALASRAQRRTAALLPSAWPIRRRATAVVVLGRAARGGRSSGARGGEGSGGKRRSAELPDKSGLRRPAPKPPAAHQAAASTSPAPRARPNHPGGPPQSLAPLSPHAPTRAPSAARSCAIADAWL